MLVNRHARKRTPNTRVASFVEIKPAAGPAVNVREAVSMAINAKTIIHPSILVISPFQGRFGISVPANP
jgi:hypothetical protein